MNFVELIHENNACGFATIANLFDPSIMVVGGGITLNNKWLIRELKSRMKKYLIVPQPEIKITKLGDKVGLYGAFAIAKYSKKIYL